MLPASFLNADAETGMTLNLAMAPPADAWLWWPLVVAPLVVALCTFLGGLAWAAAVATSHWCRSFINQAIVEIDLNWLESEASGMAGKIPEGTRLYCLVVRFGTDEYLAGMASDQERHQGRLLNRVVEIDRETGILALPVHRKLGTQFKLYYLVPDAEQAGELRKALGQSSIRHESDADIAANRIVLDEDEPAGRKCWFRLAAYGARQTVDGFGSSYFASSQLLGFERRNRLRLWRWIRRRDKPDSAPAPPASAAVPIPGGGHP